jgi:hypothetical protein
MSQEKRYFTVEQANALARAIRPLLGEILAIRQAILEERPRLWPVIEKAAGNGGSRFASEMAREFQRLDDLVREITATGAILRDINTGLVDFPALREEKEIYLCWRYDESSVAHWHEVDGGFAGRKLLP